MYLVRHHFPLTREAEIKVCVFGERTQVVVFFWFICFLASTHDLRDLTFQTRDRTVTRDSESTNPNHWTGNPVCSCMPFVPL